jgi:hypothetical protein
MYHTGPFGSGGGWLIGLIVFAAFILFVVWGSAWILRRDTRRYGPPPAPPAAPQQPPPPPIDPALQILRERFARGEIDEAGFISASRALAESLSRVGGPPGGPHVGPPS